MIVKPGRDKTFFLGCTNYKRNGTGCNNTISKQVYYEMMGYQLEPEPAIENKPALQQTMKVENKPKNIKTDNIYTKKWSPVKSKDYVEIQKAHVEPVFYRGHDLNEVVYHSLCALQNVSSVRFYGITTLCEVLHGNAKQKLSKAGLDSVPEYGIYSDIPMEDLKDIVEWLINEHYMLQTKGQYPVLHSTYEGFHYSETFTNNKLKELYDFLQKY